MKKKPMLFRFIFFVVRVFYPKVEVIQHDVIEPGSLMVANHAQIHGPITTYLFHPNPKKVWVISDMCHVKTVPKYAFEDFWGDSKIPFRWFFKLLSFLIAPISPYIMKHGGTIPVYKSIAITKTFQYTIQTLQKEEDVFIFPEGRSSHNPILNDFQTNFVDVARLYYKKHQKALSFYPVYIAPFAKKMVIGKKIEYNATNSIEEERIRICEYIKREITKMAFDLPKHRIIPYAKEKKKRYSK